MAWTTVVVIDKHQLDSGVQRVNVRFSTNDATPRTFDAPIDIAPGAAADFFDRSVRRLLALLTDKDAAKAQADSVATGNYVPGPDPPGDPDQSVKDQFKDQLSLRRQLQKAVDLGLVAANDSRYVNQVTNLKALFDAQTQAVQLKIVNLL